MERQLKFYSGWVVPRFFMEVYENGRQSPIDVADLSDEDIDYLTKLFNEKLKKSRESRLNGNQPLKQDQHG